MLDKDRVIELIELGQETDFCDFKREFYHMAKKGDMIKDILSFSNSTIYGDKYIIFNVDDKTRQLGKMKNDIIPDASEVNALLREYCEPHIRIEMDTFFYKKANVAYIKISAESADRPYLVKKDYVRDGKMILQQGQIFLRRNSDNFKANRRDLDDIYESRIKRRIEICKEEIKECEFVIKNEVERCFTMDFIFENNAKDNYLIKEIKIFFRCLGHCFSTVAQYICDTNIPDREESDIINNTPFSVDAYSIIQKSIRFELSNVCIEQIRKCSADCSGLDVWFEIQDVKKQKICSEIRKCNINFIEVDR